jgi:cysteine desulfuration protein SufE
MHPYRLQEIITHFESLSEPERREGLIALASSAGQYAPRPGESYDFEDVRKDNECSDTVGIHLRLEAGQVHLAVSLGCQVQTLTRALTAVLCRGLSGSTLAEIIALSPDFIVRIVGQQLVQLRARTIYYVLKRVQEAAEKLQAGDKSPLSPAKCNCVSSPSS